jgi:hypothetical protein
VRPSRKRLLGFLIGVMIAAVLAFLPKRFAGVFSSLSEVLFVVAFAIFLIGVSAFYRRGKREAAPAKKSDLIGYGVIAAFCLGVGIIAWRMLHE